MSITIFRSAARGLFSSVALLVLLIAPAHAEGPEIQWDLDDAIKQVNRQADDFSSALARVAFEREDRDGMVINQESGTIYYNKDGKVRIDIDGEKPRTYLLESRYLYIHYPTENRVEEYYLPRHKDRMEPFLRLGFTNTGSDLKRDFLMTSLGERDEAERRTLGLELTPDKESVRELLARAQLWIDQASWMPAQQVLFATQGGQKVTVTYTFVARNLKLNPDLFRDKWPRGTDKQKMK